MSQVIWSKFINVEDYQVVELPKNSEILCVQNKNGKPCIWFKCQEDQKETEMFALRMFGTGHRIEGYVGDYLGTFQMHDGKLVFHVFKEKF